MLKKVILTIILIVIYIGCSLVLYHFVYNINYVNDYIQNNLCYTQKTEAICLNHSREIMGDEYDVVYMYKPEGYEDYFFITYKEKDNKPDVEYLYVSKNNPVKVSRNPTNYSETLQYVISQPIFFVINFVLTFVIIVLIILIQWVY